MIEENNDTLDCREPAPPVSRDGIELGNLITQELQQTPQEEMDAEVESTTKKDVDDRRIMSQGFSLKEDHRE
jgi:hypothetical protein